MRFKEDSIFLLLPTNAAICENFLLPKYIRPKISALTVRPRNQKSEFSPLFSLLSAWVSNYKRWNANFTFLGLILSTQLQSLTQNLSNFHTVFGWKLCNVYETSCVIHVLTFISFADLLYCPTTIIFQALEFLTYLAWKKNDMSCRLRSWQSLMKTKK